MTLFHVTRYDRDGKVVSVAAVDAESKSAAAEGVCGFEVTTDVKPSRAVVSVVALGEPARDREYFRRASERQA
jgi:hypothetical protein